MAASFGEHLRRLRLDAGLTLEELAEASGLSPRGIGNLERGHRTTPQRGTVAALAQGLRLDDAARALLVSAAREGRLPDASPPPGDGLPRPADGPARPADGLPRSVEDFVGRQKELARLRALAAAAGSGPAPVVALSGPPGAGKTSLALHAARLLAPHFPGGRIMLDLRGLDASPPEPAALIPQVLRAAGVPDGELAKAGPEGHPELYRRTLAARPFLVVLDNAAGESQVRPLLPGAGPSMVLVTSRRILSGLEGIDRLMLDELPAGDAQALLAGIMGRERAEAEPAEVARLAALCGRLPLALRVAGCWLATRTGWTVARYADRLAVEERRLTMLAAGDVRVSAAFGLSYQRLTPEAARLFRLLSLVPGPGVGTAIAAHLLGRDLAAAEDALEELVEMGLLGADGSRYRLHDLLRLFARGRLTEEVGDEVARAAAAGLWRWLLRTAVLAGRWFEPDHGAPAEPPGLVGLPTAEHARTWLQEEGDNWLGAFRAAAAAGEHATVVDVAEAMHWFSDQWMFWGHWPEVFRTAAEAAQRLGDPLLEATQLNYCAWAVLVCEHRPGESVAWSSRARAAAERAGDPGQLGWSHLYSAWALGKTGAHDEAAEHNRLAARYLAEAGDVHGGIQAAAAHGLALIEAGRYEAAVDAHRAALVELDALGDRIEPHIAAVSRANLLMALGRSQTALGRWADATDCLTRAVDLCRRERNPGLESRVLVQLARACTAAGHPEQARAAYARCLSLPQADPVCRAEAATRLRTPNPEPQPTV